MGNLAPPLEFTSIVGAVFWPLAAGVAIVAWSRKRAMDRAKRLAQLDGEVRSLYRTVEARPVPQHLTMVVEALEEGEALAAGVTDEGKLDARSAADS
jgi:hypothetical protein